MSQILKRIKDLISSEINSRKSSEFDDYQMKDLEQIINELNSSGKDFENNNNANAYEDGSSKQGNHSEPLTKSKALAILELPENASAEMIKIAYKQKMKEYHPDRVSNLGRELQKLAEIKTKEINEAYEFLKKSQNIE